MSFLKEDVFKLCFENYIELIIFYIT